MNTKFSSLLLSLFLFFWSFLSNVYATDTIQDEQGIQCFKFKWSIEAGKLKQDEVFWINVSSQDIFVYQNGEILPTKLEEGFISRPIDFSVEIDGDVNLVKDKDYFTSVKLENPQKAIFLTFDSVIQWRDFYFILAHSANYHTPIFYISVDGLNYEKIEHYYIKKFPFKYVKIVFEPKPEKKTDENEEIFVSEIDFTQKVYTYAAKALNSQAVDIYSDYDCVGGSLGGISGEENLWEKSQKFEVELQETIREVASTGGNTFIAAKNTIQKKVSGAFPQLDQVLATVVLWLMILSISLYIRTRAKSKDFWILPQKVIKVKRKKVVKKVKNFLVEKHKKISVLWISSINLLIKGKRKTHEIKSKKLIKIFKLMLSHYEENKNTFFPWELKDIYMNVIDDFKEDLSKKTHKKAVDIINEFIEKWWKVIINMKDKK